MALKYFALCLIYNKYFITFRNFYYDYVKNCFKNKNRKVWPHSLEKPHGKKEHDN